MESNLVPSGERGRRLISHHLERPRGASKNGGEGPGSRHGRSIGFRSYGSGKQPPLAARPSRNDPPTPNSTQRRKR
jgi:hypothetical protein